MRDLPSVLNDLSSQSFTLMEALFNLERFSRCLLDYLGLVPGCVEHLEREVAAEEAFVHKAGVDLGLELAYVKVLMTRVRGQSG